MADSDHLVGALTVTVAVIALAEIARALRFINVLFGAWLIVAPWLLDGTGGTPAVVNSIVCGALVILLAIPRGRIRYRYAGWSRYIV